MALSLSVAVTLSFAFSVMGHGRLADPPSRNAMWMYKFPNKVNYNPNEMNCGGTKNQWENNNGRCGLCGDPYQGPRQHEAGYPGGYANGVIGRVYKQGQTIDVLVEITANHFGWFEFRLCPTNDPSEPITQDCLDKYLLSDDKGNTRHRLVLKGYKGSVKLRLMLPAGVFCSHCVLQWFWYGGNSRGTIAQETFVNCADVVITKRDGRLGAGMSMPEIPPQAFQPILETKHRLGEGKLIGLPGEWDCVVPPPHGNTEKENVFYEWCLENCLYAKPNDRSCPVDTCRCFRTDIKMNEERERQLLGINKPYPQVDRMGNPKSESVGTLDGEWDCRVPAPFNKDPEKERTFYHWCIDHCIKAKPYERDCPATHCKCWRTDKRLPEHVERHLLRKAPLPRRRQRTKAQRTEEDDPNDMSWKSQAKIKPSPNNLRGSWDCDVKAPYRYQREKRLQFYEWCVENCINADISDRHCAETHCRCYRTDKNFSPEQIRAQLSLSGRVVTFTAADGEARGIPPSLQSIINFAQVAKQGSDSPMLKGTWDCSVKSPFDKSSKAEQYYRWCLEQCIEAQPNDRHCPQTHCECFRTDVRQSAEENRRQLMTGLSTQGVIHAEGGDEGSYDFETRRPVIDEGSSVSTRSGLAAIRNARRTDEGGALVEV